MTKLNPVRQKTDLDNPDIVKQDGGTDWLLYNDTTIDGALTLYLACFAFPMYI